MKDGTENIRYLLMDMTHPDYKKAITEFKKLHTDKEEGNTLTVLPNKAKTKAIVKVVAHVGWIQDHKTKLQNAVSSGLIIKSRDYSGLPQVKALLASNKWPKEEI